jgi:hypothetical protein
MAVLSVGQIVHRVGVMLDDPANARFSEAYIMPFIDQENESFEITLERLGIQQQEQIAIIDLPSATPSSDGSCPPVDLAPLFAPGRPLEWFLRPKRIDWKLQSQPDTAYIQSDPVNELDDVQIGNIGPYQYRWAQGSIQLVPNYTAVRLRIYFFALSTDIYDDAQTAPSIMRGVGYILARQVALEIASLNNNMGKLVPRLEKSLSRDKQNLCNLLVMTAQAQEIHFRGTRRGAAYPISAGGKPFA